jgi:iron complex outermembrane receptor protein
MIGALATRLASGGLVLGVAMSASGQQDTVPVVSLGKIEVTGSHIPRIEGESGLPLQIITREDLINGGVQTMQELLERISANQSLGGFNEAQGLNSNKPGFTAASLRGLGFVRTLILLNGRRLAPYAAGGYSVDLSGIPASALERVEILKDGASAVYGSDAIGGVINFILRKDFQGAEVNANYFATEHGGGNNRRVNATAGYGDITKDRFNVLLSADYFKQDPLKASQRASTRTGYLPDLGVDQTSFNVMPANIFQRGFGGARNPTIPLSGPTPTSCQPPSSFALKARPLQCQFDVASVIETIPEAEKTSVIGRLTWQIDPDHQLFAEGSYYQGKFIYRFSPTPVDPRFTKEAPTLPPTSPYYPTAFVASAGGDPNSDLLLFYRTVELGPRISEETVDQWRAVVGLQGTLKGWDYVAAVNCTVNRLTDRPVSGYVYEHSFDPLLRSGVINPFGPNAEAVLAMMRATQVTGVSGENRSSNCGGDFKVANAVYELPSGPVALALGLEGRRESLEQIGLIDSDVVGSGGGGASLPRVHRSVWSLFGELNVPAMKSLEVNLAARYDHYSDFGGTTNPKITLRWQPAREVLLRASYGTGFRAPELRALFLPPQYTLTVNAFNDPIRCPVTNSEQDCNAQFRSQGFANPLLQPEKSRQVNAGIVAEPLKGLSASVDYYWVEVRSVIQLLPAEQIFANYARWAPTHVVRKPPDPQYPTLPGEIDYVIENLTNAGTLQTSGIDVDLKWRAPPTPIGQFTFGLSGTYAISFQQSGAYFGPIAVGIRGADGVLSRWRHYATLDWNHGPWGATLANTFQLGYREPDLLTCEDPSTELNCTGTRRVGSYSVWDLQARYTGLKNLTFALGLRNALDRPPPVSNQQNDAQVGIDPSYADPRGRMYYGTIRYTFR